MASPAASAGDLAIPTAQDPWDWTVEDVVIALTSPDGLLRQLTPQYSSDPAGLVQLIRDQSIWGSVLLRCVDDAFLEQKMGLAAVGNRCAVLDTIAELRDQSSKYLNFQMKQASRAIPSSYGPASNFGENRSIHQLQSNSFPYPMMPPLRRYLAEPLPSPDIRSIQVSQPGSSFGDVTNGVTERWRRSQFPENGGYDQSNNDFPQPEEARAAPRIAASDQNVLNKNIVGTQQPAHLQGQERSMAERVHRDPLLQDEADSDVRLGNLYATDNTGNKRRKLDLPEQSEVNDNAEGNIHESEKSIVAQTFGSINPQVETMTSYFNETDVPATDEVPKSLDGSLVMEEESSVVQTEILDQQKDIANPSFDEIPLHTDCNTATPSVHEEIDADHSLIGDHSIAAMSYVETEPQEPGKMEIDAQGRKRMRPILVAQPVNIQEQEDRSMLPMMSTQEEEEDTMSVSHGGLEQALPNAVTIESNSKSVRRRSSNVYLGVNALPIDTIFYGDTAMDEVVSYHEPQDTIFPLGSEGTANGHDSWFLSSNHSFGGGAQLYISNRLKFFLSRPEPILLNRRSETSYGIIPYPARVVQSVKRHQPLSLSLMSETSSDFITKRVNRSAWIKRIDQGWTKNRVPPGNHAATDLFDVPGDDSLLSHLGENEIHDWDFLEKWRHRANGDDVLPLYGDSGSEGELDLDTWQEIEEEEAKKGRKLERPVGLSKHKHLSNSEVSDAIRCAMDLLVSEWKAKKLPLLDRKAWRLWTRSRRDKSKRNQIELCTGEIARLEHYLQRISDKIILERWSKVEKVMKQCQSAHLTVFAREFEKWKIGILELKSPPHKPVQAEKQLTARQPKSTPESLEEDEEDLETDNSGAESSDDGLDDFIVDGGEESDDERLMRDSLQGTHSPDEDVDMLSQDVTPLVVNEEGDDISTPSERRKERQNSSSTVNTPSSDSVSLDDLAEVRDIPSHDGNLRSSSPMLLDAAPSETHLHEAIATRGSVNQLISPHDYIELTQLSDGPEPISPQIKEEKYRIHTPPLDDRNPFRRTRRAPPVFRTPPTPSNIINMESDDSPIIDNAFFTDDPPPTPSKKKSLPSSPSKEMLPGLQDIEGIASLDYALLVERQDRKRLLTWIIAHTSPATRRETLAATSIGSSVDIQWDIWDALKAIKGHAKRLRRTDVSSGAFMQIAAWYVSWHMCRVYSETNGIPQSHVKETIDSQTEFEEFYNFIVERLDTIKLNADRQKEERRKADVKSGLMSSGSKPSSQKRQKRIDDEPDLSNHTSYKKRKYAVPESQAALQMRDYNQQRFQERLRREAQLKSQFSKMGASSEDPITMIVNGKADEEMIVINKEIGSRIQPHQLEGIQFMWSEIVTNDQEQGCLLAHSMGLGKTMQVITLLVTIAEASQHTNEIVSNQVPEGLRKTRALILCPPSLVDNWYDELLMWTPGAASTILGEIYKISAAIIPSQRLIEIQKWADDGGVLLVGYNMFKNLVHNKPRGKAENKKQSLTDEEHEKARSQLLKLPTVIVADEAHTIKTRNSDISKAVQGFASKRRIALTGSPLANNLMEYYTIIDWIAPGYLGSRAEFSYKYVEPIGEGLFADATQYQKRKGLKMLQVLKAELAPKVNRADIGILKGRPQGKTEFVLRVPLTQLQYDSYKLYVDYMLGAIKSKEPGSARLWAWLAILRLLCNHPLCFKNKLMEEPKKQKAKKNVAKPKPKLKEPESQTEIAVALEEDIDNLLEDSVENVGLPKAMIDEQLARFAQEIIPIESIGFAHKMQLLLQIVQLSIAADDKVLVFSHSLDTLNYIGELLKTNHYTYERLDGATKMSSRQQLTKDFNNVDSVNVCLISTKAGGQGLNLFGANRVVIMDDTFNPMYEEQAIGRAYRIGQLKHVYVYRLTVGGTFEQALQDQSLFKLQLATRVVDKKNPMRHALKGAREYLFQPKPVDQKDLHEFGRADADVLAKILAVQDDTCIIRSIEFSETFQQEVDEPLTADEQKEAEQMVKDEQLRRTNPAAYELVKAQRQVELAQEQAQLLSRTTELHQVHPPSAAYPAGVRFKHPLLGHDGKANAPGLFSTSMNGSGAQDRMYPVSKDLVLDARGPPSSSSMTNGEWEQLRRTAGLGPASAPRSLLSTGDSATRHEQGRSGLSPGLNDSGPLSSSLMTNSERVGLASASAGTSLLNTGVSMTRSEQGRSGLSLGLNDGRLPPTGFTDESGASIVVNDNVTRTIADQFDRPDPTVVTSADAAVPDPLRTATNLSDLNKADEFEQSVPNMDPVHGPNIRVRQRSLSLSPDNFSAPGLPQRTLKNVKSLKLEGKRPRTPSISNRPLSSGVSDYASPYNSTAATATRASTDLVNPEIPEMTTENRDDFRDSLVPRIGGLISEEMRKGRLTPIPELDVMVVAKVLAESVERHAYKNAADKDGYHKNAEDTFNNLNKTDGSLSKLIDGARRKLNSRLSRSRSTTQTRQIPSTPRTPRDNEAMVSETIEADRPDMDGAGDQGESVGVSVPSPLSKPPDLSMFQSLRQMMQRGANRKTG
ncbi:hypothetical protein MMC17_003775 [Xylographa soralifera]|nr:hypothetical protein [Xylographa soralifera]